MVKMQKEAKFVSVPEDQVKHYIDRGFKKVSDDSVFFPYKRQDEEVEEKPRRGRPKAEE